MNRCKEKVVDNIQDRLTHFKADLKKFNKQHFIESEDSFDEYADELDMKEEIKDKLKQLG